MVDGVQQNTDVFHLYFGTPNTQKHRSYGIDFQLHRATKEFSADLICPYINTVHLAGKFAPRMGEGDRIEIEVGRLGWASAALG